MILLFLFQIILLLKKDIKSFKQKERISVWFFVFVYIFFMVYYTTYINEHSFTVGYGIPGADMLAHFSGAKMISQGARWTDLAIVARRFEEVSISSIGYFIYTTFVYIACFLGNVLPIGVSIYLLYVFQILLSIDACVKFGKVFASEKDRIRPIHYFIALALCIPFVVQACQLMRDVYFMWFISILLEVTVTYKNNTSNHRKERVLFWINIVLLFTVCILLRYYTIIVTLPLFLYYYDKQKLAVIVTSVEFALVSVGTTFLVLIKDNFGIFWDMTKPDLVESVSFLLFPNIINQTKYILNWGYYFGNTLDVSGCNVPGIYFIMSIWNIIWIPFVFIALFSNWKRNKEKFIIYFLILMTTVLLYSVTYDSIDTRHKLFMSLPIVCLGVDGYFFSSRRLKKARIVIPIAFILFFVFVLLISV